MKPMGELWVNWFEGEENGYNVPEFQEWRRTDTLELINATVFFLIEESLFSYIENDMAPLPKQLLEAIYRKTYIRKNQHLLPLDYCAAVTDGKNVLVFDTMTTDLPVRKSRFTPSAEIYILEEAEHMPRMSFDWNPDDKPAKLHGLLSPEPQDMVGLTRHEKTLKQILYMSIEQLRDASESEVKYWYTEWNPKAVSEIHSLPTQEVWQQWTKEIKEGWSPKHYLLGQSIVQLDPHLHSLWKLEEKEVNLTIR